MIKQFLLDYEQELLEKKIDLTKSLQKNELSKKENAEYIRFIEKSEDKSYESFSPQNYNTKSNHKKLKDLKEEKRKLEEASEKIEGSIKEIEMKLEKLSEVMTEVRKYESFQANANNGTDSSNLDSLVHRIEFCSNLIDVDPKRCKLELEDICRELENMVKVENQ